MVVWYRKIIFLGDTPFVHGFLRTAACCLRKLFRVHSSNTGYPWKQPRIFVPFGLVRFGSDIFVRYHWAVFWEQQSIISYRLSFVFSLCVWLLFVCLFQSILHPGSSIYPSWVDSMINYAAHCQTANAYFVYPCFLVNILHQWSSCLFSFIHRSSLISRPSSLFHGSSSFTLHHLYFSRRWRFIFCFIPWSFRSIIVHPSFIHRWCYALHPTSMILHHSSHSFHHPSVIFIVGVYLLFCLPHLSCICTAVLVPLGIWRLENLLWRKFHFSVCVFIELLGDGREGRTPMAWHLPVR